MERWVLWWPVVMQVVGDDGGGGSAVTVMGRRWWGSKGLGREMREWRRVSRRAWWLAAAACSESGEAVSEVRRGSGD
ncbi:hypothetical protein MRB53_028728 [Persea americana]|uniref:Uncharacterized protein n=1 Tax=Persea americana TaxID=3435 RepID=A0ACC2KGE7_PERAE|nr:hypothetical protein MRB53_028728 [Persea americana]